jgi:hypothetical protein
MSCHRNQEVVSENVKIVVVRKDLERRLRPDVQPCGVVGVFYASTSRYLVTHLR